MIKQKGIVVHPDEITPKWYDIISNGDINVLGIHPVGGEGSHLRVMALSENGFETKEKQIIEKLKAIGVGLEYELHVMSLLLPRTEFALHPEWFRLDENGERNPDYNCCASNKDGLEVISDSAEKLARLLPSSTHRYNFWLDDVRDKVCHCKDCMKYTASDQALLIYNAVLKGIKRADPLGIQSYLGYFGTSDIPRNVMPDDGIFIEYAPFDRDYHSPLSSEKNKSLFLKAKKLIEFFGTKNAKVIDYWLDNSLYSGWQKPPKRFVLDEKVCKTDLELYDSMGYSFITTFACYLGGDYEEMYPFPDINGYINTIQ